MKLFKYGLGLAALCAASSGYAATLRITNNTGLPVRVFANGEAKDIAKQDTKKQAKPQPVDWSITTPLTYVSWSEFNRRGERMTSYSTLKTQLTGSGDLGELTLETGGLFRWKGPSDASLSKPRSAAREGVEHNDLVAKEAQDQLVDFIKSQPEKEQTCWVLALTLGVIDPIGIDNAKNKCLEQSPENQKKLVAAQMGIVQAKALKKEPAPMPADLDPIYKEIIVASQKTTSKLPAALDPKYSGLTKEGLTKEQLGQKVYDNISPLSVITLKIAGDPLWIKLKWSITQFLGAIVMTIASFGTAAPVTGFMIALAVSNIVMSAVSTAADVAAQVLISQKQEESQRP